MTIHKAQGLTCDQALVYATDDLYQELGYVAMSRGRDTNRLYLAGGPNLELAEHAHTVVQERTAEQALLAGLSNSHAQELAIDALGRNNPHQPEEIAGPGTGIRACRRSHPAAGRARRSTTRPAL